MKMSVVVFSGLMVVMSIPDTVATDRVSHEGERAVESVTGIGGFFFKAADPAALAQWYQQHLGISPVPDTYEIDPWSQAAGPTVFAPFGQNTMYFGRQEQTWMINFRVRDLDAMVGQLQAAGIEVEVDPQTYPNGRFARLADPEGNPIQLWQPAPAND
jgi:glyoxylase I family protein